MRCHGHAVEFSGHQLQARVLERSAAVVDERHPAVEVGAGFVAAYREHVVGAPGKIAREVGRLHLLLFRPAVSECPQKRGAVIEIFGQIREANSGGIEAGDNFISDFPDRPVVVGNQRGFHFFHFSGAGDLARAQQGHFAAHVFRQQFCRLEQVVLVVLLKHGDARGIGQRAKVHRRRIYSGGYVHELEL